MTVPIAVKGSGIAIKIRRRSIGVRSRIHNRRSGLYVKIVIGRVVKTRIGVDVAFPAVTAFHIGISYVRYAKNLIIRIGGIAPDNRIAYLYQIGGAVNIHAAARAVQALVVVNQVIEHGHIGTGKESHSTAALGIRPIVDDQVVTDDGLRQLRQRGAFNGNPAAQLTSRVVPD